MIFTYQKIAFSADQLIIQVQRGYCIVPSPSTALDTIKFCQNSCYFHEFFSCLKKVDFFLLRTKHVALFIFNKKNFAIPLKENKTFFKNKFKDP